MKNDLIKLLDLTVEQFAEIVKDLKAKGYTLDDIEKMVTVE